LPPNPGQSDLRLTREGGGGMVLRKDKVEIGKSAYDVLGQQVEVFFDGDVEAGKIWLRR